MLAAARHVAAATRRCAAGQWERSRFTGVELAGKTLGVVGLGRIGVLVAQRLQAFEMTVLAYDPYVSAARAAQLGVRLVGLEELLARADVVSVHLPRPPRPSACSGEEALRRVPSRGSSSSTPPAAASSTSAPSPRPWPTARVGAAGLDVYAKEPCTDSPLFGFDQVVATPHLGASTDEAQEKAGRRRRPLGPAGARRRAGARRGQRRRAV